MRRPVLVISSDAYNRSRIATVVCIVITSNIRLADAPGNVLLDVDEAGLDRPRPSSTSRKSSRSTRPISTNDSADSGLRSCGSWNRVYDGCWVSE